MSDQMDYEETWQMFLRSFAIVDKQEVYTNGSVLVPLFRVEQMVEHYFDRTCHIEMDYEYEGYYDLPAYWRWYACSECGERFAYYKHDSVFYCPNCGAKVVD